MPIFRATVYYEGKEGFPDPLVPRKVREELALDKEDFKRVVIAGNVYPVSFGPISMKKEG